MAAAEVEDIYECRRRGMCDLVETLPVCEGLTLKDLKDERLSRLEGEVAFGPADFTSLSKPTCLDYVEMSWES